MLTVAVIVVVIVLAGLAFDALRPKDERHASLRYADKVKARGGRAGRGADGGGSFDAGGDGGGGD